MILCAGSIIIISMTVMSGVSNYNAAKLEKRVAAQAEARQLAIDLPSEDSEPQTSVQTETVEVDIPFTETKRADSNLTAGEEVVAQKGVNGKRSETYNVTYVDGVMQDKTLVNTVTTKQPVTQIVNEGGAAVTLASRGGEDVGRYSQILTMTATAYTGDVACTGKSDGITATGVQAKKGVVAVDPNVIPLGSKLYIESSDGSYVYGTAVAADTGGAIKGNKIDLCFNTYQEAVNFGRKSVKVYVLQDQ